MDLDGAAELDGAGPRLDEVAEAGRAEVVDGQLHAGHPPAPGRHVRAHARQGLRRQRRHAADQHPERLAAGGGDGDRKSTRLNSSHSKQSRMPSSA